MYPPGFVPVDDVALFTFKLLDIDGNDMLDAAELETVLKKVADGGQKATTDRAAAEATAAADGAKLFAEIDVNKDGKLSRDEWGTYFNQLALSKGRDEAVRLLWQLDEAARLLQEPKQAPAAGMLDVAQRPRGIAQAPSNAKGLPENLCENRLPNPRDLYAGCMPSRLGKADRHVHSNLVPAASR